MREIMDFLRDFSEWTVVIRLFLALLLGGAIGFERQRNGHAAGLRTHILVCLGSAMTVMTGLFASVEMGYATDPLRIGAQVISGIGFIGAGTIIMTDRKNVKGLTTAAGLWSTAAIGLAIGCGFYEGALFCSIIILVVMASMKKIDRMILNKRPSVSIYFEVVGSENVNGVLKSLEDKNIDAGSVVIKPAQSGNMSHVGIECTVQCRSLEQSHALLTNLCGTENVAFAIEKND